MLSKNELKYIQTLCHKKQRQSTGRFIAEGSKLVDDILQSDYVIEKIYALPEWLAAHPHLAIESVAISADELAKISLLQTPNQVLAIVKQKVAAADMAGEASFTLVLDGIQDPGNMGTIIRIADWFGIKNIIASEDTVELYNPKVIQATMGSFTRVNVAYQSLEVFFNDNHLPVFGALLQGESIYQQEALTAAVLVIGNEAKGIRNSVLPFINIPVTIPRIGGAESLNAAVAAGIIVSHLRK
jgi:TrmH family RNA methyltransferase